MKRKAIVVYSRKNRHIAIDVNNKSEIYEFVSNPKRNKKFRYIVNTILDNLHVPDLFDKEDINDKCKDVAAMKFFKGGENSRIYCKVLKEKDGLFFVIASEVYNKKKNTKNQAKEVKLIEKVAGYEYEIIWE